MTDDAARCLLIAHEDPDALARLAGLLEGRHELVATTFAAEVPSLARKTRPDLVLLSAGLCGAGAGVPCREDQALCTRLVQTEETAGVPVLLVARSSESAAACLSVGAVDVLLEPVPPALLQARVAAHLDLVAARRHLSRLDPTDAATGVASRGAFDRVLLAESRRLHRSPEARLSLVLIGIDHFTALVDGCGAAAGDDCLHRIAALIAARLPPAPALCARFERDVFACLLPEMDRDAAMGLGESVRAGVAALAIPHPASADGAPVTASVGVATVTPETQGFVEEIVRRADVQLQRARLAGRNRVLAAEIEDIGGQPVRIPGLDMHAGLARVRGNVALYFSLLRGFLDRHRSLAQSLRAGLEQSRADEVRHWVHTVRGVAANLGAASLAQAAAELEQALLVGATTSPERDLVARRLYCFEGRLADILGGIETFFRAAEGPPARGRPGAARLYDVKRVRERVQEGLGSLESDLGAALGVLTEIEADVTGSPLEPDYRRAQTRLHEMDLDGARAALSALLAALGGASDGEEVGSMRLAGPQAVSAPQPAGVETSPRPRILVVDDGPENLIILVEALKEQYAVSAARTGGQALVLAARTPQPDLILLGVGLPDVDGYEVCRRLKATPETAQIPVLFLTGLDSVEHEARGLQAGAADYIRKPITYPVLDLRLKLHLALIDSRRKLEEQNRQLVRAAQAQEEIQRVINHDLRTPLDAIVGSARHLVETGGLTPEQDEMLGHILGTARDMANFIKVMHDVSRIEAGDLTLNRQRSDLGTVIRQAVADLAAWREEPTLPVAIRVEPSSDEADADAGAGAGSPEETLPPLGLDRSLVRALFTNLIKNALEASPSGAPVEVRLRRDPDGRQIRVAIHNQGAVAPEIRPRFFDKYVTLGKPSGTGLGTYSARLIARAHGGDIDLESAEASGTTVLVRLPLDL